MLASERCLTPGARSSLRALSPFLATGVVAHALAGWFSIGPHQVDEHFQILEFLNYKLHHTPAADLPWEFAARIRPWIQVSVLYTIARLEQAAGIVDPFTLERTFRLLFALLGLTSGLAFTRNLRPLFRTERCFQLLVIAECLYWPIVYVHARLSSEAFGTTLLLFGLIAAARRSPRRALISGFFMGFGFMVRFQLAFCVAGALLHACFIARWPLRNLVSWALGFGAATLLGVLADRWGYGAFVFTPVRYFVANILEGRAAAFGVSPPWDYFVQIVRSLVPPFSVVFLVGFLLFCFERGTSIVTWVSLPLLVGHLVVGHKELRFLFPLVPFAPVFFLTLVERCLLSGRAWLERLARGTAIFYAALGAILLPVAALEPALTDIRYFQYVHDHLSRMYRPLWLDDPPMQLANLPVHFYRPEGYEPRQVHSWAELGNVTKREPRLFFMIASELPKEAGPMRERCPRLFGTVPGWMTRLGIARFRGWEEWTLFSCGP